MKRNQWNGIEVRKSICNVKYMQIVVNGLKLVQPPVWSFLKVVAKCWILELTAFLHCSRLARPHIDSKIQSVPLPVTQLLSKALLSAEPAVLDAVEIVNPSVWWIWWWIQILIPAQQGQPCWMLALCGLQQGA